MTKGDIESKLDEVESSLLDVKLAALGMAHAMDGVANSSNPDDFARGQAAAYKDIVCRLESIGADIEMWREENE